MRRSFVSFLGLKNINNSEGSGHTFTDGRYGKKCRGGFSCSKKLVIISILFALFIVSTGKLYAQKSSVQAKITPSNILIGQQSVLDIQVRAPKGSMVIFPNLKDTVVSGIEILGSLPNDTVTSEIMTIHRRYRVTSFDSLLYHIPPLTVIVNRDTLQTNNLGFKVELPQLSDSTKAYLNKLKSKEADSIDFKQLQLKDIKKQMKPPFFLSDYIIQILIGLVIIVVIILIVLGVILFKKKKSQGFYFKPKPIRLPHEIAIEHLNQLKESKMWEHGNEKQFHISLTDIVREYIQQRFNIDAPEMITDDIIRAILLITESSTQSEELSQILSLADLVKFAKYIPLPEENSLSLANAYLFINQTKDEVEEKESEDLSLGLKQDITTNDSNKKD